MPFYDSAGFFSFMDFMVSFTKKCKLGYNKIICEQLTVTTRVSQVENITVSSPVEMDRRRIMDVNAYQRITATTDTAVHLQM